MQRLLCALLLGTFSGVAGIAQSTHQPAVAGAPLPPPDPVRAFSDNCAACHQNDGKGIEGAFPALAGDPFVMGPPEQVIYVVLEGRGGMPTFRSDLTDEQIAAAITHVRSSWGNAAPPVSPAQVAAMRTGAPPRPEAKKVISAH